MSRPVNRSKPSARAKRPLRAKSRPAPSARRVVQPPRRPKRRSAVADSTAISAARLVPVAGGRLFLAGDREIEIDDEFAGLCPPCSAEEDANRRASLAVDGCRDALLRWAGTKKLIEGHCRFRDCDELGIPFRIVELEFPDRESVKQWIRQNQLGRRNLAGIARSVLRGEQYLAAKPAHGGNRKSESTGQLDHLISAEDLAQRSCVAAKTIHRDAELATAVRTIEQQCGRAAREAMLRPGSRVTGAWVRNAAAADPPERARLIEELIANGKVHRAPRKKRRDDGFLALPREPKSLAAQVLLDHYGPAGLAELMAELAKLCT